MEKTKSEKTLTVLFPNIAIEWNKEKNIPLDIDSISVGSSKKVWWKCSECGYEWSATIYNRCHNHSGCPECGKKKREKNKRNRRLLEN